MRSLSQIRTTLQGRVNNEALFSLLNTRIMLRTGVDLKAVAPADDANPERIQKVLSVIDALGYGNKPAAS